MKRSEINKALKELEAMCRQEHCYLPPFCHFTPEEWKTKGHEYDEVRDCMLGWDITDYGLGDFDKVGFSLITIRNGNRAMQDKYPKVYAEKLLYMKEGQYSPNHFHWYKTEDIINRGGGNVLIRVYNSLPDESIDKVSDVTVHCDGKAYTVPAGTQILINATCVGFGADADKAPDICYDTVTPDMYVSDVVFNPTDPLFLQKARARGAKTLNGVGMMVQQGAINFTIWTGEEAPVDVMYEALSHELG